MTDQSELKYSGESEVGLFEDGAPGGAADAEEPADASNSDSLLSEADANASIQLSRLLTNTTNLPPEEHRKIPPMGGGRPLPPKLPSSEIYTVSFEGPNDPLHPFNWPLSTKVIQCITIGSMNLCVVFDSAVFSETIPAITSIYHIAPVVATLGTSLFTIGFAVGPIVWGPMSEVYGRRPVLILSSFLFTVFNFAVACSDRLEAILICRFFAGCLGAAPLVVVPASFADMFGNKTRGTAIVVFIMTILVGPMMAPFCGAFITANPHLGWRWTEFVTGILAAASCISITFFERESHHPVILIGKARILRRTAGNWGIHAAHEEVSLTMKQLVEGNLKRPLYMLFTEPILFTITLYLSFIFGMLYLFLTAYPIVFRDGYHMAPGVAELPFIALIIGLGLGGLFCISYEKVYNRKLDQNHGRIVPENRLPPLVVGSVAFPIGVLWLCWTGNYPDRIHWIVPTISGLFTGFGTISIFVPCLNYIVDSYLTFAASAMAANNFLRSGFGGASPIFATFMFVGMGTNWAGLLLGMVAVVMIIFPLLFLRYGRSIRGKSKFAID
ncbi:DEKNAAC103176 [Brettanomyces naardenensis]|uniref:DEKNAAC103176 n=1 Tax=Brettanomyces naardenensis TaxID=13370 RepID=A0A448YMR0_BRENA|nr:DEKNAAC103176 [Brettanomyces naardenensis]